MFGMDLVVTITGTAMALVCSILWIERPRPRRCWLVPILVAFVGYRAYVHERQGHEKVKFLYEANRTLSESPEVAVALEGLLERALEAFRAEQAEIILFAADGGAPLRTGLGPGTAREAMAPVDADDAAALRDARRRRPTQAVALARAVPGRSVAGYLDERGIRHGMLGVLRGEDRVIGTLHARQPLRPHARLHRRRPRAVRHAGRQRVRRAAVRPPRAGRHRAARPAGPAHPPGPPRPADRARQPRAVLAAGARGARDRRRRARSP